MKKFIYILLVGLSFLACEDVIDLDLNSAEPRLVIDATLKWEKESDGKSQFIKLSLSAPFYTDEVPPANGANVSVTNSEGIIFYFIEEDNTGIYRCYNFIPKINETYTLNILYKDDTYMGTEQLVPVVGIDRVEQKNDGGFGGDDIEIKAFYTDPIGLENYYLFKILKAGSDHINLEVYDDEFVDGNQTFAFYSGDDFLETGDELNIYNHGISKQFYEFMVILLQQTAEDGGGPFETQPATVRGNCVNTTNPSNYPFGYFRASEVSVLSYIVK